VTVAFGLSAGLMASEKAGLVPFGYQLAECRRTDTGIALVFRSPAGPT
jgi:hypothetical protein